MPTRKLAAIVAALATLALTLSASGSAGAAGPVGGRTATLLSGVSMVNQVAGHSTVTLSAKLLAEDGTPSDGEQVVFYELSTVFGQRLMTIGSAMTDATGNASLPYEPTWGGQHTVVVRYGGDNEFIPAQTTFRFDSTAAPHLHQNASFGLSTPRKWAPLGAGLAVLGVWGILGLALVRTVLGIATAAPVTALATSAGTARRTGTPDRNDREERRDWAPRSLRPASLSPLLLALVALTTGALVVGLALPLSQASGPGLAAQSAPSGGSAVQPGDRVLAAHVTQSIPAFLTDEEGRVTPNSPDLPADVEVMDGRVFVLDTNNGRLLTVTPDGQLARIFESDPDGQTSVARAEAMTAHGSELYVAAPLFGNVVEISSNGHVDGVIQPQVPKGARPFHPAGIAVTDQGNIWLSDSNNHRVVLVSRSGVLLATVGRATAASGSDGFDMPGGLALDSQGHLWVVDTGNHEVKEYSSDGTFVRAIGHDALSMPEDVAVDGAGRVFVTDQSLREIRVFGTDGVFLGSIGKSQATAGGPSDSGLQYPRGIKIDGSNIYVMDRLSGMFVFQLGAQ